MKFNINERVKVKLTAKGIEHLEKQHNKLVEIGYPYEFKLPQVDKDGYTEFQLHDLMQTFGKIMFPGCELPFKTDIIIPDEKITP
jgi:hypothetical protein